MVIEKKLSLNDVQINEKRVIMRVDFNVPLKQGEIQDYTRIRATLPTIKHILDNGAKCLILLSHLGRPCGNFVENLTLRPIAKGLEKELGKPVIFIDTNVGEELVEKCKKFNNGEVILLENIRFYPEEEGKKVTYDKRIEKASKESIEKFSNILSQLADIYVNDAFGTAHRPHTSVVRINLPIRCAGFLMHKELASFACILNNPKRPYLSILGGAKVRDKIKLINNLLDNVDYMIIGGGMAWTFLKVLKNMPIGDSLWDEDGAKTVPDLMKKAEEKGVEILLPVDFVISSEYGENGIIKSADLESGIPEKFQGLDCGPKSIERACEVIAKCKTIVWNGPLGVCEMKSFAKGSIGVLDAVIKATENGAVSVIGGGDTACLVQRQGLAHKVTHVSTGGGASLELLEGKILPGIDALTNKA